MTTPYTPTAKCLAKLAGPWCCSFSGGKDSTSLVTWLEFLRRKGTIQVATPKLVRSDTGVEEPGLDAIANGVMDKLRASGWVCATVQPKLHEKLYNRILGIGNTPIHPGITNLRWCSRSTKIDPMERWRKENAGGLVLTGIRLHESTIRDGKIKRGCAAGGECGLPAIDERTYSPVINWSTCQIIDWLQGHAGDEQRKLLADLLPLMQQLVEIYRVQIDRNVFPGFDPAVSAARFGCIGCPAIMAERHAPTSMLARHGNDSPLLELYDVWFEARRRCNRLWGKRRNQYGPIKIAVRKKLFRRVMDIQRRAGVVLITPEDEKFIRQCWRNKVYPRGWSEADEATLPPSETPLLDSAEVVHA